MENFHIRDLITEDPSTLLLYPVRFSITFDDGQVIETSRRRTFASSFFWTLFREFPEVEIDKSCHIETILGKKKLQSSTHIRLASNVYKAIANKLVFVKPKDREIVQLHLQRATNELYNNLRLKSPAHLQTIHLLDCIELMFHPTIYEACRNMDRSPRGVEHVYKVIQRVIDTDPSVQSNSLVIATRSGSVKFNQVCQSIGVRGYPKEVNGRLYRTVAQSNYLFGMVNLFEFAADSRGSAEHLSATESPLQDSEYFSRRLQLQTCVVQRIHYEDCGTSQTIPWYVRPSGIVEATGEPRHSDLRFLVGKMYVDHDGRLKAIEGNETHLEGTTIQLRSVLTCEHSDPHGVCQVCFGKLSNNHSQYINLGIVSATTIVSRISQRTLSTKHFVASGTGTGIIFTNELRMYFRRGPKNTDYVLQKDVVSWNPKLVLARDDALGLMDVEAAENIDSYNPERITWFTKARFIISPAEDITRSEEITVGQDKRSASLSMAMLQYVKKHGYTIDERNNFVIDLKHWDAEDVIFTLPDIQVSFSAYGNNIASVIESSFENLAERQSVDAPLKVFGQLVDLITAKMDINFAPIEVVVYALMQAGPNNHSLGRLSKTPVMGLGKDLIWKRSLGTALAYQQWDHLLLLPETYESRNKPSTIMDTFLDPHGYLVHHSKTYPLGNYQMGKIRVKERKKVTM